MKLLRKILISIASQILLQYVSVVHNPYSHYRMCCSHSTATHTPNMTSTPHPITDNTTLSLLAEVHALNTRNAAPKYTILLCECNAIVIMEWWYSMLHFIGTQHAFPSTTTELSLTRQRHMSKGGTVTTGIIHRHDVKQIPPSSNSMELKVNLRDCNLIFIEDASTRSSLALPIQITCVLHIRYDDKGVPAIKLDAQSLQLCMLCVCVCVVIHAITVSGCMSRQNDMCALSAVFAFNCDIQRHTITPSTITGLMTLYTDSIVHYINVCRPWIVPHCMHYRCTRYRQLYCVCPTAICLLYKQLSMACGLRNMVMTRRNHLHP
jgi:hypothetical protein